MPSTSDKLVGRDIWRIVRWYLWRRYGTALKRAGAGTVAVVAIAGAIALAQRRNGSG